MFTAATVYKAKIHVNTRQAVLCWMLFKICCEPTMAPYIVLCRNKEQLAGHAVHKGAVAVAAEGWVQMSAGALQQDQEQGVGLCVVQAAGKGEK
jgi:hypothetical protein